MTFLLPLLAFLFISLLIAAIGMSLLRGETAIERRLGELGVSGRCRRAPAVRSERLLKTLKRLGQAAPKPSRELGKLQRASGARRLSRLRGADRLLRHPPRPGDRAVRARHEPVRAQVEPAGWPGRRRVRLPAAGHGARAHGEAPPAPHPAVAARCARPARRQRRGRTRSRPGDSARRRRAGVGAPRALRAKCG